MRRVLRKLNQWFDRFVNGLESGLRKEAVLSRPDLYSTDYRMNVVREEPIEEIEPVTRTAADS